MNWILAPGMACDHRLFDNITDLLPNHEVLRFELPAAGERLEAYAVRLARQITLGPPYVFCGMSLGGMLLSTLCERYDPQALVLMSSTAHPAGLAHSARAFEWLSRVWPDTFAAWIRRLGQGMASWVEPLEAAQAEALRTMVRSTPLEMIRRHSRMVMDWKAAPVVRCERFHIHGARDMLLPVKQVDATTVVPGAGHLLNITHPAELRAFVTAVVQQLRIPESRSD